MPTKTGLRAKLYVRTAVKDYDAVVVGDWLEMKIVGDVMVTGQWDFAEARTRESAAVRGARTMLPLAVSGRMRIADEDALFVAFDEASFSSDNVLDVMVLNGDKTTNGVTGYRAEWELTNWSEDQALGNVLFKDFELKPTFNENMPKRVKVVGAIPVFTDFD